MFGIGITELLIILTILVIGGGCFALWVWAIVDCATRESFQGNEKLLWLLIIILGQAIGAVVYLLVERPKHMTRTGL